MPDDRQAQARLRLLWVAYGLSGAAALADEVVWTRYLQVLLGSSVYAVAATLSALMAGLALGAWIGARIGDRVRDPARAIAACEVAIAAAALSSLAVLRVLPALHLWAFQRFQLSPLVYFGLDALVCIPVVLAPTTLMGMIFPLVARLAHALRPEKIAEAIGGAYAANTAGAIAGSALAGFVLVPLAGLWGALVAAAGANIAAAALVLGVAGRRARVAVPAALLLAAVAVGWLARPTRMPVGYHLAGRVADDPGLPDRLAAMRVVFDRWPAEGRVQVLEDGVTNHLLLVDGRIEGSTRGTEYMTQHLLALVPGALRGEQRDVFAIGLGTGRTLVVLLDLYRTAKIELAEVNPAVVDAVRRYFRDDLGSYVTVGDGRRMLELRRGPFDAIVSGPSFPVDAMSASLFTREFFELARARLRPAGLLVAWVPGYLLDREELRALVATAAGALPHVSVWRVVKNDDYVLLASPEPFDDSILAGRLARIDEPLWASGVIERVLSPAEVRTYIADGPAPRVNTDTDPWLELAMARNLVRGRTWLER